ncbi:MAG: ABC transporter permease [Actinobacteria bacterium]|nr:ABC transporter permease [Actinomycetota bacterium]
MTRQDRPVLPGSAGGGAAGRRVVTRWAWRLLRREWRQQVLVLALLALTVGAASFGVAAAYNLASLPGPQFGSAGYLLQFAGAGQKTMTADIEAARKAFGTIQVIGHQFVPIPGSTQTVEYRALSPDGPYTGPMLALVQGHYPAGAGQVAVTSGVAQNLQVRIGSVLSLTGHHQRVTGIVENPSDLNDQFALVPPSAAGPAQEVTVLLDASPAAFSAFRDTFHRQLVWQARGASTQAAVAAGALGAVTVLMALTSLVAAAAFTVIAARRQRQLGMLAAIGATRKQLRMVMVASGALVGVIAAVAGAVIGLAAWFAAAPHLQAFAGHRIDRFAVPWGLVVLGMLLAILTAAGAAWWPARAASHVPIVNALSARPLKPRPAHRTAIMGMLLTALALACLTLANQANGPLVVSGALAMTLGIPFISPLGIRVLNAAGRRAPVAVRLALRDLARYQARSAAALAAISLALGIAISIMISASAATHAANEGNLPGNQMLIWIGEPGNNQLVPARSPAELSTLAAAVQRIAASLGGAAVVPLDMPVNPANKPQPGGQQPVVSLNAPVGQAAGRNGVYRSVALYVATSAVLRLIGINPATIGQATRVLTTQSGQDVLTTITTSTQATNIHRIHVPDYSSEPTSLITMTGLRHEHWTQIRSGWMVTSARPLQAAQIAAARDLAARTGLVIESRNTQVSLATIRTAATAAGALIALGVLAMAVGLIRAEAAGDVRTLTAIGAASTTRRTLTATTAGTLALLGALLGSGAAYLALAAGHRSDISVLSRVPVLDLAITLAGVPAAAALAGWILAGRKPPSLARQPLD